MTTLTIDLPDNLAEEAKQAGLLTPNAIRLRSQYQRQAELSPLTQHLIDGRIATVVEILNLIQDNRDRAVLAAAILGIIP